MKKLTVFLLAFALTAACLFCGCNGADGGKVTENGTVNRENNTAKSSITPEMTTREENLPQELATDVSEFGSRAESKAEEIKTDAESAVSELFENPDNTNVTD